MVKDPRAGVVFIQQGWLRQKVQKEEEVIETVVDQEWSCPGPCWPSLAHVQSRLILGKPTMLQAHSNIHAAPSKIMSLSPVST